MEAKRLSIATSTRPGTAARDHAEYVPNRLKRPESNSPPASASSATAHPVTMLPTAEKAATMHDMARKFAIPARARETFGMPWETNIQCASRTDSKWNQARATGASNMERIPIRAKGSPSMPALSKAERTNSASG